MDFFGLPFVLFIDKKGGMIRPTRKLCPEKCNLQTFSFYGRVVIEAD